MSTPRRVTRASTGKLPTPVQKFVSVTPKPSESARKRANKTPLAQLQNEIDNNDAPTPVKQRRTTMGKVTGSATPVATPVGGRKSQAAAKSVEVSKSPQVSGATKRTPGVKSRKTEAISAGTSESTPRPKSTRKSVAAELKVADRENINIKTPVSQRKKSLAVESASKKATPGSSKIATPGVSKNARPSSSKIATPGSSKTATPSVTKAKRGRPSKKLQVPIAEPENESTPVTELEAQPTSESNEVQPPKETAESKESDKMPEVEEPKETARATQLDAESLSEMTEVEQPEEMTEVEQQIQTAETQPPKEMSPLLELDPESATNPIVKENTLVFESKVQPPNETMEVDPSSDANSTEPAVQDESEIAEETIEPHDTLNVSAAASKTGRPSIFNISLVDQTAQEQSITEDSAQKVEQIIEQEVQEVDNSKTVEMMETEDGATEDDVGEGVITNQSDDQEQQNDEPVEKKMDTDQPSIYNISVSDRSITEIEVEVPKRNQEPLSEIAPEPIVETKNSSQSIFEEKPNQDTPMKPNTPEKMQVEQKMVPEIFLIEDTPRPKKKISIVEIFDTPIPSAVRALMPTSAQITPKSPKITMRRKAPKADQQPKIVEEPEDSPDERELLERSILKRRSRTRRSLSTSALDCTSRGGGKRVQFHSPANKTMILDDIDTIMKQHYEKTSERNLRAARRKRSMSAADVDGGKQFKSRKMPNFTAMHNKQFKEMESIADYVGRVQEKAEDWKLSTEKKKTPQPNQKSPARATAKPKAAIQINFPTGTVELGKFPVNEAQGEEQTETLNPPVVNLNESFTCDSPSVSGKLPIAEETMKSEGLTEISTKRPLNVSFTCDLPSATAKLPIAEDTAMPNVVESNPVEPVEPMEVGIDEPVSEKPVIEKPAPNEGTQNSAEPETKESASAASKEHVRTPAFKFNVGSVSKLKPKLGFAGTKKPLTFSATVNNAGVNNTGAAPLKATKSDGVMANEMRHRQMVKGVRQCNPVSRSKSEIKGVRLNKRFLLMMQYRDEKK